MYCLRCTALFLLALWMKLLEKLGKNKHLRFYEPNTMYQMIKCVFKCIGSRRVHETIQHETIIRAKHVWTLVFDLLICKYMYTHHVHTFRAFHSMSFTGSLRHANGQLKKVKIKTKPFCGLANVHLCGT